MKAFDWIFLTLMCLVALASCGGSDSKEDSNYDDSYSWKDRDNDNGHSDVITNDEVNNGSADEAMNSTAGTGSVVADSGIERIIRTYKDGGVLSQSDYAECVDYLESCFTTLGESLENAVDISDSKEELDHTLDAVSEKVEAMYPYAEDVLGILENLSESDLGSRNSLRFQKIFSALCEKILSAREKATDKFNLDPTDVELSLFGT